MSYLKAVLKDDKSIVEIGIVTTLVFTLLSY